MSIWIPVIVAVVTGALTVLGQKIIANGNNEKLYAKLDKQSELSDEKIKSELAVMKTEIKTLSDRVNKHNDLIDRMYHVEAAVTELQHKQQKGA